MWEFIDVFAVYLSIHHGQEVPPSVMNALRNGTQLYLSFSDGTSGDQRTEVGLVRLEPCLFSSRTASGNAG